MLPVGAIPVRLPLPTGGQGMLPVGAEAVRLPAVTGELGTRCNAEKATAALVDKRMVKSEKFKRNDVGIGLSLEAQVCA